MVQERHSEIIENLRTELKWTDYEVMKDPGGSGHTLLRCCLCCVFSDLTPSPISPSPVTLHHPDPSCIIQSTHNLSPHHHSNSTDTVSTEPGDTGTGVMESSRHLYESWWVLPCCRDFLMLSLKAITLLCLSTSASETSAVSAVNRSFTESFSLNMACGGSRLTCK